MAEPWHLLHLQRAHSSLPPRLNRVFLLLRLRRLHRQQHLHLPLRLAIPVPALAILVRAILPRDQKLVLLLTMTHLLFHSTRFQHLKVLRL